MLINVFPVYFLTYDNWRITSHSPTHVACQPPSHTHTHTHTYSSWPLSFESFNDSALRTTLHKTLCSFVMLSLEISVVRLLSHTTRCGNKLKCHIGTLIRALNVYECANVIILEPSPIVLARCWRCFLSFVYLARSIRLEGITPVSYMTCFIFQCFSSWILVPRECDILCCLQTWTGNPWFKMTLRGTKSVQIQVLGNKV